MSEPAGNESVRLELKLRRLRRVQAELIDQGDPVPDELENEIRRAVYALLQLVSGQSAA